MNARALVVVAVVVVAVVGAVVGAGGCSRDAQAPTVSADPLLDAPPSPVVTDAATTLLFSFVDANGRVQAVPSVDAVPEAVRQRVLVVDLGKTPEQRQAHRYAWFADLTNKSADGSYPVVVVSRYDAATRAGGAAVLPPPAGSVVIYSAEWCGYCKKAKAWLTEKGVPYIERDVEKTAGAQAELSSKLTAAGVSGGGIPVVDWAGELIVGFDVAAFDRLLKSTPAPKAAE